MVFGNVDSVCNYLAQLYALIGTAGNLQAVTAAGNSTTYPIYSGSGTSISPNTGVKLNFGGVEQFFNSGNYLGYLGNVSTGLTLAIYNSTFLGSLYSGPLTANRNWLLPDEGNGVGLGSTIVLHKTQYPDTIGNPLTQASVIMVQGIQAWAGGRRTYFAGDNGGGGGIQLMYSPGHGGITEWDPDTSASGLSQAWAPPMSTVLAGRDDTVSSPKAGSMGKLLTPTSGVTPTGTYTLINKRWVPRHHDTTTWATPTINTDLYEDYSFTAHAANITSVAFSGTPNEGQTMCLHFKGTATRTITGWSGVNASTIPLPLTTAGTAILNVSFIYTNAAWYVMGTW
jgi:hypothetical protein